MGNLAVNLTQWLQAVIIGDAGINITITSTVPPPHIVQVVFAQPAKKISGHSKIDVKLKTSETYCTANEGPLRVQYKCLVPRNETVQPPPYFQNRIIMFCLPIPIHSYCISVEIYIFPASVCLFYCNSLTNT